MCCEHRLSSGPTVFYLSPLCPVPHSDQQSTCYLPRITGSHMWEEAGLPGKG